MNKFKIGDKVKMVDIKGLDQKRFNRFLNKVAIVQDAYLEFLLVYFIDSVGCSGVLEFFAYRFIKLNSDIEKVCKLK